MDDTTTLGPWLRSEREQKGLSLKAISESTKVSGALLEGLEADDISRWPGGIFRRAFVKSYAEAIGLDADDVYRRFERQYQPPPPEPVLPELAPSHDGRLRPELTRSIGIAPGDLALRARYLGTAADLTVAAVLAFGSAAAGSRLLWPVLLIAIYYAVGILLTGTSPMVALLGLTSSDAGSKTPPRRMSSDDPHPPAWPEPSRLQR